MTTTNIQNELITVNAPQWLAKHIKAVAAKLHTTPEVVMTSILINSTTEKKPA